MTLLAKLKLGPSSTKADEAAPEYAERRSSTSTMSDSEAPPPYADAIHGQAASGSASAGNFTPTTQLQIQATGVTSSSSLNTQEPVSIPVFRAQPGSASFAADSTTPEYVSLRIKRGSNSCALVRGSDPARTPLNATIYRWGPGRNPRMRLLPPHTSVSVEEAITNENVECDVVDVRSRSIVSRSQRIATPFGTFQWRYGSRSERKETFGAYSLLILEKLDDAAGGKSDKNCVRLAQFVRNDEFRTPGTSKWMAGNGGRLMIDLGMWANEKEASIAKVEAFVVASCICMLKREVDRMRDNTTAAIV